jgi:SP family facilitated glucose transporter-like MFS transporter 8
METIQQIRHFDKCPFSLKSRIRGALGSLLQLLVVVGFLFEYCIGPYVTYSNLAIVSACVPIMFAVSFFFFPESPYHLLATGKHEDATKALQWFRGQSREAVQAELCAIQVRLNKRHLLFLTNK